MKTFKDLDSLKKYLETLKKQSTYVPHQKITVEYRSERSVFTPFSFFGKCFSKLRRKQKTDFEKLTVNTEKETKRGKGCE